LIMRICLKAAAVKAAFFGLYIGASAVASAQTFNGAGGGPIPDAAPASGSVTSFAVSALSGSVRSVSVNVNITHSYLGDLRATLIAPNGIARLTLFSRVGQRRGSPSDNSNISGTYTFSDAAALDLWAGASAVGSLAPGAYRTSTSGTELAASGGCSTHLDLAFGALTPAQANGNWTLIVSDSSAGDTGTVNAAGSSLSISTMPESLLFRSGFEDGDQPGVPLISQASSTRGNCTRGVDATTDSGLTDFIIARPSTGTPAPVTWFVKPNNGTSAGLTTVSFPLGNSNDLFFMGDYDGDGISDASIYTRSASSFFTIRRSSRPNDVPLTYALGNSTDLPNVAADFDGDGVTDFAVFRKGTAVAEFFTRASSTGRVTITNGGVGGTNTFGFALRDANGDGASDFATQTLVAGNVGEFKIYSGVNSAQIGSAFQFGLANDFIIPGNFVGSALTDITSFRTISGQRNFFTRDGATGVASGPIVFSATGEFVCPGDYDGDGLIDLASWRTSTGVPTFVIRRSSQPAITLDVPFGQTGDYPVNNWDVH
jgi:subtilisin-like proprotein convertase family protein